MVLTVTLNPCVDRSVHLERVQPGRFNQAQAAGEVAGGKGINAARMLAKLGTAVAALTLLGGKSGELVADLVRRQDGFPLHAVWTRERTRTITTVFEQSRGRATAYVEPNSGIAPAEAAELMARYEQLLGGVRLVAMCGSSPQPILDDCYRQMIALARARGVATILDSYGEALARGLQAEPDLAKPNLAEAERWAGRSLPEEADRWQAMAELQRAGAGAVCLSLGRAGVMLAVAQGRWRLRPPRVRTVNPVGSGDCLVAGLAHGMVQGWPLLEGARLGTAAGAANAAVWEAAGASAEHVWRLVGRVRMQCLTWNI